MNKEAFTTTELAEIGLPGLPKTTRALLDLVKTEGWAFVESRGSGRGGVRREYTPPAPLRALIQRHLQGGNVSEEEVRQARARAFSEFHQVPGRANRRESPPAESRTSVAAPAERSTMGKEEELPGALQTELGAPSGDREAWAARASATEASRPARLAPLSAAHIEVLREVVEIVETALEEADVELAPTTKARVIVICYEYALQAGALDEVLLSNVLGLAA